MSSDSPINEQPESSAPPLAGTPESVLEAPNGAIEASAPQESHPGGKGNPLPPREFTFEAIERLIEKMINPVKDRQEEEFQKIRADIKAELSVIKDIPTAKEMAWGLIAVFLGAVGLIVALAAVMGDRFDNGISIGSSIGERLEETKALNLENSRNMKRLLEKLETIPPEAPKP